MQKNRCRSNLTFILALILSTVFLSPTIGSAEEIRLSTGQTIYVPIYSHIYSGVKARPFDLAATLSIRNTNLKSSIELISVKYFDSEGKLVKDYLEKPIVIDAIATTRYIITEDDRAGGSGANFIVIWKSEQPVNPPVIEGVMIGTHSGQGISFVSRGQVIKEDR
ncbi:MAG: DUF3124 domain-containing protein [Desulfobacterales bacterium]|nr:DUF3124 domain-containing protein [Desulfobacterales bacterium]